MRRSATIRLCVALVTAVAILALLAFAPAHVASHRFSDPHHQCSICLWYSVVTLSLTVAVFMMATPRSSFSTRVLQDIASPGALLTGDCPSRAPPLA